MSVLGRAVLIWKAGQGTGDVLARPAVHDRAIRGWVSCVKLTSCHRCVGGADFVTAGGCDSGSRISFSVGRDRTTGFAEDETAGGVLMSECHSCAVRETGATVCACPDKGGSPALPIQRGSGDRSPWRATWFVPARPAVAGPQCPIIHEAASRRIKLSVRRCDFSEASRGKAAAESLDAGCPDPESGPACRT